MNGRHHLSQIKKNWAMIVFILMLTFGAGGVYTVTRADFVQKDTFDLHVQTEGEEMDLRFKSQTEVIELKFKNTNDKIKDLGEHLEDIKELIKGK